MKALLRHDVGDSIAVLSMGGTALRLSFDHKTSESSEAQRISQCGGFVRGKRVAGVITVSRSFGDHLM
jgi:protein phosphatase PTC1